MKYKELLNYLNENKISAIKVFIAEEVDRWCDRYPQEEYECICARVFDRYLYTNDEPNIYDLVQIELEERGYEI